MNIIQRRNLSLKKAIIAGLFLGILMPTAVLRFIHQDSFDYLFSDEYVHLLSITVIMFVFSIFIFFFLRHRCPNCKKNWCYEHKDHHVLDRSTYDVVIKLVRLKVLFCAENQLQESYCTICDHKETVKSKKRFIEIEKEANEGI
jgi:hypothetical protein